MPRKCLTFAHLCDQHVAPGIGAEEGLATALQTIQHHPDAPQMIVHGGDYLLDAFSSPREVVREQWALLHHVYRQYCRLPVTHCLGNHDIWGWHQGACRTTPNTPGYGKAWAMDELGLARPYYSFDRAGWHFIVLDSIRDWGLPGHGMFQAVLDCTQREWLEDDLSTTPVTTPICVIGHVPILSEWNTAISPPRPGRGEMTTPCVYFHMDSLLLRDLFARHPNVRLHLSGHLHRRDRLEHQGVTYIGSGAVSGELWRGDANGEMPRSFSILTLYDDGSFDHQWVDPAPIHTRQRLPMAPPFATR